MVVRRRHSIAFGAKDDNRAMNNAEPKANDVASVSQDDATGAMFRDDPELATEYLNQVLADGSREELLLAMRCLRSAFGGGPGIAQAPRVPKALLGECEPVWFTQGGEAGAAIQNMTCREVKQETLALLKLLATADREIEIVRCEETEVAITNMRAELRRDFKPGP